VKNEELLTSIVGLIHDQDPLVRALSLYAVARQEVSIVGIGNMIGEGLRDPDSWVRRTAAWVAVRYRSELTIDGIRASLQDVLGSVRAGAAEVVVCMWQDSGNVEYLHDLEAVLNDEDSSVAKYVEWLCRNPESVCSAGD
jgi:HEAT repeat protein